MGGLGGEKRWVNDASIISKKKIIFEKKMLCDIFIVKDSLDCCS